MTPSLYQTVGGVLDLAPLQRVLGEHWQGHDSRLDNVGQAAQQQPIAQPSARERRVFDTGKKTKRCRPPQTNDEARRGQKLPPK